VTILAAFISLIVSFVREDFLLLAWKEAWFLLFPKIDDDHVTKFDGIVNNLWLSRDGTLPRES